MLTIGQSGELSDIAAGTPDDHHQADYDACYPRIMKINGSAFGNADLLLIMEAASKS